MGLFVHCDGTNTRHPVPYAPINETIYLNTPSAYDLQFVGGSVAHLDWGVPWRRDIPPNELRRRQRFWGL